MRRSMYFKPKSAEGFQKEPTHKQNKIELMSHGLGDDRLPLDVIVDKFKSEGTKEYGLLDSGMGRKLERVGPYLLDRQCAVAFWSKQNTGKSWDKVDATHERTETGGGFWKPNREIPPFWFTKIGKINFKTKLTAFGHLGFFAEQATQWEWFFEKISAAKGSPLKILNLFAYTGASSIACAQAGAQVTHVDAARGVVDWARQNAAINRVPENAIRYAVEDCKVFLEREAKRGNIYDGVILDPPSFGRGPNKEVFKIEDDIVPLLRAVKSVLSPSAKLLHFTSHSQGFSPEVLRNLLAEIVSIQNFNVEGGEMFVEEQGGRKVPSGQFIRLSKI